MPRRPFDRSEQRDPSGWRFVLIGAAVMAVGWAVFSWQEAAAFNRVVGGDRVTTWDAMFVQLRVIEPAE